MWYIKNKKRSARAVTFMLSSTLVLLCSSILNLHAEDVDDLTNASSLNENNFDEPGVAGNNGPVSPGTGYAPLLINDTEGTGGVLSFVAQKPSNCADDKKCCEKLVIALTPEAIKDKVSVELYYHQRYPENEKWKKSDEKLQVTRITPKSPNELITIIYNSAGHKGTDGGFSSKDTHRNWQLRLLKNGVRIGSLKSNWKKYLRVLYATANHKLEDEYNGTAGMSGDTQGDPTTGAFLTAEEIDKLVNWGFFTDEEQSDVLQLASQELVENNEIASGEMAGQTSFSALLIAALGQLGLKFMEGVGGYLGGEAVWFVLGGLKSALATSKGCSSSRSNLTIDKDLSGNIIRYNVILAK